VFNKKRKKAFYTEGSLFQIYQNKKRIKMAFSFIKSTYKYGIMMGLGFCLYTTFIWLTKLDTNYLNIGQYLDTAIIALPIAIIFMAINHENKAYPVTILQRIGIAIFVGLISFLIYDPFLYAYHNYINPTWFNAVLELHANTLKASGMAAEDIAKQLDLEKNMNAKQAGLFKLGPFVASVIVLSTLIALISFLFIKSKKN
jgi:Protein of unknown function (DUF4199)